MQPYQLNPGLSKFVNGNHPGGGRGCSKKDKLVTKNANRGRKKSFRQYLKNIDNNTWKLTLLPLEPAMNQ